MHKKLQTCLPKDENFASLFLLLFCVHILSYGLCYLILSFLMRSQLLFTTLHCRRLYDCSSQTHKSCLRSMCKIFSQGLSREHITINILLEVCNPFSLGTWHDFLFCHSSTYLGMYCISRKESHVGKS